MEGTKISLASIALNKGQEPEDMFLIENDFGVLIVQKDLFVISFEFPSDIYYCKVKKELVKL